MSQELIQKIIGREITSPPFKVEAQHMINYAESVGVFDPKYREVAFPGYVSTFVLPALWYWRQQIPEYKDLVKDPRYIVHGGQKYDFNDAVIKPGDILSNIIRIDDIFLKKNMLFLIYKVITTNQNGQLVLTTTITIIVRPGGF
ncbi:MAG TPA: MaoC family dehydratase N-terminal domain-containing protein [Candidatus Deferrimicrobium sp.]|nr:MaoC family dehydratase N-terminal domain-containing protein [Candidatus Deferrimicrobium sp.]